MLVIFYRLRRNNIIRSGFLIPALCAFLGGLFIGGAAAFAAPKKKNTPHARKVVAASSIQSLQGYRIQQIAVKGLKRIEKEAILNKVSAKVGAKIDNKSIQSDIQKLYDMGYFDEIEVQGERAGREQAILTYVLRERPIISELVFEGNEKIETSDLEEVAKVKVWSILDVNQLREDVERIQKHYEDKGFYLAKVRFEIQDVKSEPDKVKVIYKINDYDKVKIKRVTFLNNRVFSDEQLKKVMGETQEGGFFSFMSGSGSFKESSFKQDLQRLTYWYLDHGYVKFRYENPVVTVSEDKKWLFISVYVDEGDPYDMGDYEFGGDLLFEKSELRKSVTLENGERFQISKRNFDIQVLTEKYQDLGYAFVNVIPRMKINDENHTVDIEYDFEKGNLVYFGEINIVGNSKTHDDVIRRELRIFEGKLYNGTNLRVSRERVERLGYFAPGEVVFNSITRKGRDDLVDIEVQVKERSTGTITLGAGYGSVQKFFLTTQISEINLLGRGQSLSFQAQWAADNLQRSFNLGFTDPYAFNTRWSMGFDFFYVVFRIPDRYVMRKDGFDFRMGHPITDDIQAYITYKLERLRVQSKESDLIDSSADVGLLSSVVWSVVRDLRNNRFETTGGDYQSVSLETAGLGGDKRFLKWNLNNRYYTRLFSSDLVFRNSTEYGQIAHVGDAVIPPSEKFYLGGPNNMRGFDLFSVGPKRILLGPTGSKVEPFGGAVQIFSLSEVEYPLIREAGLKWVLFFDIGNSFNKFPGSESEPWRLREDWGFGLRWFSPIGPLRFEWGFPLDKRSGEDSMQFYFFIGPPF